MEPLWVKDSIDAKIFTPEKCESRALDLRRHTAGGASGVTIEALRVLPKWGWQAISCVFQVIADTGIFPESFKLGLITLISKKPHKHGELSNTRPITALEITYRLFTNMIQTPIASRMAAYLYDLVPEVLHAHLR